MGHKVGTAQKLQAFWAMSCPRMPCGLAFWSMTQKLQGVHDPPADEVGCGSKKFENCALIDSQLKYFDQLLPTNPSSLFFYSSDASIYHWNEMMGREKYLSARNIHLTGVNTWSEHNLSHFFICWFSTYRNASEGNWW